MTEVPPVVFEARQVVKEYPLRGGAWRRGKGRTAAVAGVSLGVRSDEIYGLVGESGAGKSTLARLLAALEPPDSGTVLYGGMPVNDGLPARRKKALRRTVQIVFQDPAAALDPLQRVGDAVAEPLIVHSLRSGQEVGKRVQELMLGVGLPNDEEFLRRLPHRISGGERQRVVIARALACEPRGLILDEPVTALDVSVRGQVLNLLGELRDRWRLAMLLVAHDLDVVGAFSDRVGVMLAGRIVEEGSAALVLGQPLHPYTVQLLAASRRVAGGGGAREEQQIGVVEGCPFRVVCPHGTEACRSLPALRETEQGHSVACHFPRGG